MSVVELDATTGEPSTGSATRGRPPLTIALSSLLLALALVACLAVMAAVGLRLTFGMGDAADGWRRYDLEAATKADALSELRGHLGLGGVIDRVHELRSGGAADAGKALDRAVTLARANLNIYRDIVPPTPEERTAIAAIAAFLDTVAASTGGGAIDGMDARRQAAVTGLATLNSHLSLERARLTAATLTGIEDLQRLMRLGGGAVAVMVLTLAAAAVWFTQTRILAPLRRLVTDAGRLARRDLDQPFVWRGRDELNLLGRALEDSRASLAQLFAAIEEKTRRLSESERRYAMAAEAANDGLWDWDLARGAIYLSPRLRQILGLPGENEGAIGLSAILATVDPRDRARLWSALRHARRDADAGFEVEFRTREQGRGAAWVLLRGLVARDTDRRALRLAGSASDVSDRKGYEARLMHQATHDFLTGLPNRAFLMRWLRMRQSVDRHTAKSDLALMFVDLDGFKTINDSLGHGIGDRLLVAVADRISGFLGKGEFATRLGGDEFIVTLPAGQDAALERARTLEAAFREPLRVGAMELRIGVSIGVAVDDGASDEPESLLRDADIALFRAKERGKGQTALFDVSLREAIQTRNRLEQDLPRAIETGDIFLAYQPIVALPGGRVAGFEALVRWRHPELGLISPAQFIPVAEETGLILPLGRRVLELASGRLAHWRGLAPAHGLTVNVNLSPRQMLDPAHIEELTAFVADGRADGLKIEITESATVTDHEQARRMMERFHELGVSLCMDDFGTGYSSLSNLGRLPFDVLKIDKSFISALGENERQESLVRGIIELAHAIGLSVVAEGVETVAERDTVSRLGCDFFQGYLFARPLPVEEAEALVLAL